MEFPESLTRARGFAEAALALMDRHGVPPNPNNFAIWYTYCADNFPELRQTINRMLSEQMTFTPDVNADLYERFFGFEDEKEQLTATNIKIEKALTKILDYVKQASRNTNSYGMRLDRFASRAGEAEMTELQAMVGELLRDTRRMVQDNRQLMIRLDQSTREIAQLQQDLDEMRKEATTDALTGLANRRTFDEALRAAANDAREENGALSLVLADVDHFKRFNDSYGHQLGDQVLKLVAKTITECIKGRDKGARYGGEEFAVILPGTTLENALKVADQIRRQLGSKRVVNRRTNQFLGHITISLGVSEYVIGEPLTELIRRADEALYDAKRAGRNRVMSQVASPESAAQPDED